MSHVWNVSTGAEYVIKEPPENVNYDEVWENEAAIMKGIKHVS